ncbi:uncharacterized protein LOC109862266 [Pseudomyrmex gracilis]|uniref:uncharacterized protein LOC109862266 n=1 Tax=Pseudomyrmex gracilis TaxID=219809 RepID=UPI0009948F96|nr:uncharacterized protein LOC109862266 [Pseudomyrmex gracilis]
MNPDKPSTSFEGKPSQRTHSNIDLEVEGDKKNQLHHDVPIQDKKTNEQQTTNILDFPDEVLLCILKNVDISDLKNLRLCCTRLSRLAEDKFLWKLDYRKKPILVSQMLPYDTFLEPLTHTLAIRGDFDQDWKNLLSCFFFSEIKQICQVLNTLIIEDFYISVEEIMPSLATTIEELQIINCRSYHNVQDFQPVRFVRGICYFVPYIKRLTFKKVLCDLEGSLVTYISNLTELEELSFISCFRIKEFRRNIDVSSQYKCQKLKILDFRNTAVEDRLVEWFCHIKSLEELYLECPKFLRKEWSFRLLQELENIGYRQNISLIQYDEMLQVLLDAERRSDNRVEIIGVRDETFRHYLLSKISDYIIKCNNLKKLHIRHYWRVTRTNIDRIATTLPNLIELDITGCCVTLEDVKHFESQRPNVQTYSSFSESHDKYKSSSV